jgi:NADPH-dependent glutamate synthase beta subunit-like oxidoreductase
MMRYGIPSYGLPATFSTSNWRASPHWGCSRRAGTGDDLTAERQAGRFDAVFAAVGADLAKRVDIPQPTAGHRRNAVSFLRGVASDERATLGRHVTVYGGGDTAIDIARVARRLGAEDTVIIYPPRRVAGGADAARRIRPPVADWAIRDARRRYGNHGTGTRDRVVFAGGHMVPCEHTVTVGVGHGKKADDLDCAAAGAGAHHWPPAPG